MNIEQEIIKLKEQITIAERDGRNPIAIQGKFETIFSLVDELRNEFYAYKLFVNEKFKSIANTEKEKPKLGRPKQVI